MAPALGTAPLCCFQGKMEPSWTKSPKPTQNLQRKYFLKSAVCPEGRAAPNGGLPPLLGLRRPPSLEEPARHRPRGQLSALTTFSRDRSTPSLPKRTWKGEHRKEPSTCFTTSTSMPPLSVAGFRPWTSPFTVPNTVPASCPT